MKPESGRWFGGEERAHGRGTGFFHIPQHNLLLSHVPVFIPVSLALSGSCLRALAPLWCPHLGGLSSFLFPALSWLPGAFPSSLPNPLSFPVYCLSPSSGSQQLQTERLEQLRSCSQRSDNGVSFLQAGGPRAPLLGSTGPGTWGWGRAQEPFQWNQHKLRNLGAEGDGRG